MIKKYLDNNTISTLMKAISKAHNGKELVWVDMDGVVADFEIYANTEALKMGLTLDEFLKQKQYRHVEGFYRNLPLIPGAKEAILQLSTCGKYELNFLSAPSWGNVSCFSDKRIWIQEHFGKEFEKKMDLSFHKGHYLGHYLIDDRVKYGAEDFIGEHIQYGNEQYPDWNSILNKLL